MCVLFCDDARLAIAFTGLATHGSFSTRDWIRETLCSIGRSATSVAEILEQFRVRASQTFAAFGRSEGRIAVMAVGFVYWGDQPANAIYLLSNLEQGGELSLTTQVDAGVSVQPAGTLLAWSKSTSTRVATALASFTHGPGLVRKVISEATRVASDPRSAGMIGTSWNSALVHAGVDTAVNATYHSVEPTGEAYGADVVVATSHARLWSQGPEVLAGDVLTGPPIRKTDPCWCNSGKHFGHCHSRTLGSIYLSVPGFRRPMFPIVHFDSPEILPSGRAYSVVNAFT